MPISALKRIFGEERGVALPLALFGLVSVSLLVTTALVTSSTEVAISNAHQGATESLYVAEGGLQAYVAQHGTAVVPGQQSVTYTPPGGASTDAVRISAVHLATWPMAGDSTLRVFTLTAQPVSTGGRTVAAMLKQVIPPNEPPSFAIKSAVSLAGNLRVNGNAFTVDGRSRECGSEGVKAVRHATDSQLTFSGDSISRLQNFYGVDDNGQDAQGRPVIENSGLTRQQLNAEVLGGATIHELAARVPQSNWRYRDKAPKYSDTWLASTLLQGTGGVAVVDAQGGTLKVGPGTYQGMLIVVNGNLEITNNATFDGIVLVERNFTLGGSVTINGALISLAQDGENVVSETSSLNNGAISINYNKCSVDNALQDFAEGTPSTKTPILRATAAWLEVVR